MNAVIEQTKSFTTNDQKSFKVAFDLGYESILTAETCAFSMAYQVKKSIGLKNGICYVYPDSDKRQQKLYISGNQIVYEGDRSAFHEYKLLDTIKQFASEDPRFDGKLEPVYYRSDLFPLEVSWNETESDYFISDRPSERQKATWVAKQPSERTSLVCLMVSSQIAKAIDNVRKTGAMSTLDYAALTNEEKTTVKIFTDAMKGISPADAIRKKVPVAVVSTKKTEEPKPKAVAVYKPAPPRTAAEKAALKKKKSKNKEAAKKPEKKKK